MYAKKEKIYPSYNSKYNSDHKKQVIHLMIRNGEKWHYIAIKKLSALLWGITSKNIGNCYCLNRLNSFRTKNNLKSDKNLCEYKDFCNIAMPSEV